MRVACFCTCAGAGAGAAVFDANNDGSTFRFLDVDDADEVGSMFAALRLAARNEAGVVEIASGASGL